MIRIEKFGNNLALVSPIEAVDLARSLPDRRYWKPDYAEGDGAWIFVPTGPNVVRAGEAFPDASWSEPADAIRRLVFKQQVHAEVLRESRQQKLRAPDFKFSQAFPPFEHQEEVFALSRDLPEFALFMEMGTGKTRIEVDTGTYLRAKGEIDAVLVVCPNSVKDIWAEEIVKMAPEWSSHEAVVWSAGAKKEHRERSSATRRREPADAVPQLLAGGVDVGLRLQRPPHRLPAGGGAVIGPFVGHIGQTLRVDDEEDAGRVSGGLGRIGQRDAPSRKRQERGACHRGTTQRS